MEKQEIIVELRSMIDAGKEGLSAANRKRLRVLCEQYGVTIANTRCKSCYLDAAIILTDKLRRDAGEETRKYLLRDGARVMWGGGWISNATLTDEAAERMLRKGFPKRWFAKYPGK